MQLSRRRALQLTGGAVGTAVLSGCLETTPERDHLATADDVLTVAHRGSKYLWPENTLLSIERAIETGADIVEFDLDVTADGTIVVIHDETVDRTTDGTGRIDELADEVVAALDAGYHFPPDEDDVEAGYLDHDIDVEAAYRDAGIDHRLPGTDGDEYPFRNTLIEHCGRAQHVGVPTLREVFSCVSDMDEDPLLLLEPKRVRPDPERLADLIREFDMTDSVLLGAFETEMVEAMREEMPDLETGLGSSEVRQFLLTMRASEDRYDPPGEFLFAPHDIVRPSLVERAHRNGVSVLPWTVNEPEEMRRLLDAGVDGLVTDDHILAQRVVDEHQ